MAKLISVSKRQVKTCDRCGTLITFHINRYGKRYPVEVEHHPQLGMVYRAHYGAYNNMTMWHQCEHRLEQQHRMKAEQRERELIARKDEIAREYLPRMMEIAQNWNESRRAEIEAIAAEYGAAIKAAEEAMAATPVVPPVVES